MFLKEQRAYCSPAQEGKACEYLLLNHTLSSCANMTCNKNKSMQNNGSPKFLVSCIYDIYAGIYKNSSWNGYITVF